MEKVYILVGESGYGEFYNKKILGVFSAEEKAVTEKNIIKNQMKELKNQYTIESIKHYVDDILEYAAEYDECQREMNAKYIHTLTINECKIYTHSNN